MNVRSCLESYYSMDWILLQPDYFVVGMFFSEVRIYLGSTYIYFFHVSSGMRQGSILPSTFFNMCKADWHHLLQWLVTLLLGCVFIGYRRLIALFFLLVSFGFADFGNCMKWTHKKLLLNRKTSKQMVFKNKLVAEYQCLNIDNSRIDSYWGFEYLGSWFCYLYCQMNIKS